MTDLVNEQKQHIDIELEIEKVQDIVVRELKHSNGALKSRALMNGDIIVGKYLEWHSNGVLAHIIQYNSVGQQHGEDKSWYANGLPECESNYLFDALDGPYISWFPSDREIKRVERKGNYVGGLRHGKWIKYTEYGSIEETCEYKLGKRHGKRTTYHLSGKLHRVMNYENDIINGSYECFNEQGQPITVCNYVKGKLSGELFQYDNAGQLISHAVY